VKLAVTYKSSADEYPVAYGYEYAVSDADIWQSRVRWDGLARRTDAVVSETYYIQGRPAVASGGARANLVAWEDGRNAATMAGDIYGDLAKADGDSAPITLYGSDEGPDVLQGRLGGQITPRRSDELLSIARAPQQGHGLCADLFG
jgi:hypothetical protein